MLWQDTSVLATTSSRPLFLIVLLPSPYCITDCQYLPTLHPLPQLSEESWGEFGQLIQAPRLCVVGGGPGTSTKCTLQGQRKWLGLACCWLDLGLRLCTCCSSDTSYRAPVWWLSLSLSWAGWPKGQNWWLILGHGTVIKVFFCFFRCCGQWDSGPRTALSIASLSWNMQFQTCLLVYSQSVPWSCDSLYLTRG